MTHGLPFRGLNLAIGLALVVAASTALAQQQPQRGRGGPGFGGPGGGGGSLMQLLGADPVKKEIELLDDQQASLRKANEEIQGKMREVFSGIGNIRELPEAEREKKMAEMREKGAELTRETNKKIQDILLPHQFERLQQISLQSRGAAALNDPEVAGKLKVSDSQKEQLAEVQRESGEKMRGLFQPGGGGDREEAQKKFAALREETNGKLLAVLSAEQRELFEKMKGPKVDFDLAQLRGLGGGRPGGGQPGAPNARPGGQGGQPRRPASENNN